MTKSNTLFIGGNPVPQGSSRAFTHGSRVVVTSDNPKLKYWRKYCAALLRANIADSNPIEGPVEVLLDFYLERPKSHYNGSGTLRKGYGLSHTNKPDVDKLVRAMLDSCTDAGVWNDDAQVVRLTATKNYADRDGKPGVRVEVRKVGNHD